MLRNLILDWSGTLADDLGPVVGATNLIFGRFGKAELLLEEFRERFRLPFDAFDDELLPDVALSELEPLSPRAFGLPTHCRAPPACARVSLFLPGYTASSFPA